MIGVIRPEHIEKYLVEETFQMLKIPWEYYVPGRQYDVIITFEAADPPWNDMPFLNGGSGSALLYRISKGLEDINNVNRLSYISKSNNIDSTLQEIREALKKKTVLVEIPAIPWNYSHMIALTHDIDLMSIKEKGLVSIGYAMFRCLLQGKPVHATRLLLARFGLAKDPWDNLGEWMDMESKLGVRSTMYFIPQKGKHGKNAPKIRACGYEIPEKLLKSLIIGGWEVGVHGIDSWYSPNDARNELMNVPTAVGNRVHWLTFETGSWKVLDMAGFSYDSTVGLNHDILSSPLQVYRPRATLGLLELPIHIQDISLLGRTCRRWFPDERKWGEQKCLNLNESDAKEICNEMFERVKELGGVITLSWHNDSITPPRNWGKFYHDMVEERLNDGAWVTRAVDIVEWFRARRKVKLLSEIRGNILIIDIDNMPSNITPGMRIRIHIPMKNIKSLSIRGEQVEPSQYMISYKEHVDMLAINGQVIVELNE